MLALCLLLALASVSTVTSQPKDCPCVTWKKGDCTTIPDPADYINASLGAWVWKGATAGCSACDGTVGSPTCAYVFPCFGAAPANMFGHHIVLPASVPTKPRAPCNVPLTTGGDAQPCEQWWPAKGPQADMFTWGLSQSGSAPNANLGQPISYTQETGLTYVLARSTQAAPYPNCGPGDTGWVELSAANNTFGCMHYADGPLIDQVCGSFEVAYCNHCPKCPPPGAPPSNATRPPECPPCPKPPPPPPPAPPGGQPCIRFGHAIPTTEDVDITITQGSVTYTWSSYKFSQFSGWVTKFAVGNGQVTVKSGGKTLLTATKFLTPGPLVMALTGGPPTGPPPGKGGSWPPKDGDNIEMIAASFVPPKTGSKVRLFNLATDVPLATLTSGGTTLASNVKYTLGSIPWAAVPASLATFSASAATSMNSSSTADAEGAALATASFNPPAAPEAFTAFLLGTKDFGYTLVPEVDAPEFGPCRPGSGGHGPGPPPAPAPGLHCNPKANPPETCPGGKPCPTSGVCPPGGDDM